MRLFISYAHVDKINVNEWIVKNLRAAGYDVWIDDSLAAGKEWSPQLEEEIQKCYALVFCVTHESLSSEVCIWEVNKAVELGKQIIPVLLRDTAQLPRWVQDIQYVDFRGGPDNEHAVARLLGGLRTVDPTQLPPSPKIRKTIHGSQRQQFNWLWGLIVVPLVLLIGFVALQSLQLVPQAVQSTLAGANFRVNDFGRRSINLLSAPSEGIPVTSGDQLEISDIWIMVPTEQSGYEIEAEIYASDFPQPVGLIYRTPVLPGLNRLEQFTVTQFEAGTDSNKWIVQSQWEYVDIIIFTFRDNNLVGETKSRLRLDPGGTGWAILPPDGHIVSLTYSINNGPQLLADFRSLASEGLGAAPGDLLTLHELYYVVDENSSATLEVEAFLVSGDNYDELAVESHAYSQVSQAKYGLHIFNLKDARIGEFIWPIAEDRDLLRINLVRDDGTILETLGLPLKEIEHPGLIENPAPLVSYDVFTLIDFEPLNGVAPWTNTAFSQIALSQDVSLTGTGSLAIKTTDTGRRVETLLIYDQAYNADILTGSLYWPAQEDTTIIWAQICMTECFGLPLPPEHDQWYSFTIDLSRVYPREYRSPISTGSGFRIAANIETDGEYTFYLDDLRMLHKRD